MLREVYLQHTFEQFFTTIRVLIKSCSVCDNCRNATFRDIIFLAVQVPDIQESLLKERNISLGSIIDTCRAAENARLHSKAIRPETVNRVSKSRYTRDPKVGSSINHPWDYTNRRRNEYRPLDHASRPQIIPPASGIINHQSGLLTIKVRGCDFNLTTLTYILGGKNPTDDMSVKPLTMAETHRHEREAKDYVIQMRRTSMMSNLSLKQIACGRSSHFVETEDANRTTQWCESSTGWWKNWLSLTATFDYGDERGHPSISKTPSRGACAWRPSRDCQHKGTHKIKGMVSENERYIWDGSTSLFCLPMHISRETTHWIYVARCCLWQWLKLSPSYHGKPHIEYM